MVEGRHREDRRRGRAKRPRRQGRGQHTSIPVWLLFAAILGVLICDVVSTRAALIATLSALTLLALARWDDIVKE